MPAVSTYSPAREVGALLVEVFRKDAILNGAAPTGLAGYEGGLLFPDWAPRLREFDHRIYTHQTTLPADVNVRDALPRIMFACRWYPHEMEQEPDQLTGAVVVRMHVVVPDDQEEVGDQIMAYAIHLALSTPLSSPRILASGLYMTSDQPEKSRLEAFDGAWEYVSGFRSASGSSLQ